MPPVLGSTTHAVRAVVRIFDVDGLSGVGKDCYFEAPPMVSERTRLLESGDVKRERVLRSVVHHSFCGGVLLCLFVYHRRLVSLCKTESIHVPRVCFVWSLSGFVVDRLSSVEIALSGSTLFLIFVFCREGRQAIFSRVECG